MINDLMLKTYLKMRGSLKRKKGQAMVEYVLIIAFIAVAVIALLTLLRTRILAVIQKIIDALTGI